MIAKLMINRKMMRGLQAYVLQEYRSNLFTMKLLPILLFLLITFTDVFANSVDSLPNWNIYYKKAILISGDQHHPSPSVAVIDAPEGTDAEIMVTINYDAAATHQSTLSIRQSGREITSLEFRTNPSGVLSAPSVRNGSDFVIPLSLILKSADRTQPVDFVYSDGRVRELNLGSIRLTQP
jgi:hypothetical protein